MRGKDTTLCVYSEKGRITPAHAGKSNWCKYFTFQPKDHPRTCGEKSFPVHTSRGKPGSPPHMRGKVQCVIFLFLYIGITPAHAGKSDDVSPQIHLIPDHPRTCGEKCVFYPFKNFLKGSPPHMRGKASVSFFFSLYIGITPAHAGKREIFKYNPRTKQDHPRTCGEKVLLAFLINLISGSPPHMRGKVCASE